MADISVHTVGDIDSPKSKALRIVHVSDTHLKHQGFIEKGMIPDGDVLVHSGDFDYFRFKRHLFPGYDFKRQISEMVDFFNQMPHRYKIFVSGNHETNFPYHTVKEIQECLPGVIYLQDSLVEIEGVRFYGSPWCGKRWYSFARSYVIPYPDLHHKWDSFPQVVDVLITHSPPLGILDLAEVQPWQTLWQKAAFCDDCQSTHSGFGHFGCGDLRRKVQEIKPKLHLFGHCHERNALVQRDGVLFSNAAMAYSTSAHIIDYYRERESDEEDKDIEVINMAIKDTGYCTIL